MRGRTGRGRAGACSAVALLAIAALSGCAPAPAPGPSGTGTPEPTASATTTPLTSVEAGQCYDASGSDRATLVDCAEMHRFEVFASLVLTDAEYAKDAVTATATQRCQEAFGSFVGVEFESSSLSLRFVAPSRDTWGQGDREVLCVVFDPTTPVRGSLAGSAR